VKQRSAGSLLRPYFQHWMPSTRSCVLPHSSVPQVNAYLKSMSITTESYPALHPQQGTGQLQQTQEIDGVLVIAHQKLTAL